MAIDMQAAVKITAGVTGQQAVDQLRTSLDRIGGAANGLVGKFNAVKGAVGALAAVLAVREVVNYANNLLKAADALDELSQRTGVNAELLSKLEQSAQMAGVSMDAVATGMKKLAVNLVEAQNGSEAAAKGFKALGLDPNQFKTSEQALFAIAERFKNMEDGANKIAISQALMGKAGEANIPWLNAGAEAMQRFQSVFTPEFIGMSARFTDLVDEMGFNFRRSAASAIQQLLPALSDIFKSFTNITTKKGEFQLFFDALSEGLRLLAAAAQYVIAGFRQMFTVLTTAFDASGMVLKGEFSAAGQRIKEGYDRILQIGEEGNARVKELMRNSLIFGQGTVAEIRERAAAEAGANDLRDRANNTPSFNPNMAGFNTAAKGELEKIERFRIEQQKLIQARYDELKAVDMTAVEYEKLKMARELDAKVAEMSVGMSEASRQKLMEVADAIKAQTAAALEYENRVKTSFEYGAKTAIKKYAEEVGNMAKQTEELFTKAFKGMEDALVNFVMTGKLNFNDLANSIIADIVRIQVRSMIVAPLVNALKGFMGGFGSGGGELTPLANGGIMTAGGAVPLRKYASGGIANSPQLALFGEGRTPEAYVPLPDGRRIPVALKGGGSSEVKVNVYNQPGQSAQVRQKQTGNGLEVDVIIEQVESGIARNIQRGNGIAPVLERQYGLNRAAGVFR